MAITPLYTKAELDSTIAKLKAAELALMTGVSEYTYENGGSSHTVKRRDLAEIRTHLQYLQAQRMQIEGVTGPQAIVGRVYRG
ncbi:MAG: hypothetical protein AB7U29_03510 [Desulfobulbus sp.]